MKIKVSQLKSLVKEAGMKPKKSKPNPASVHPVHQNVAKIVDALDYCIEGLSFDTGDNDSVNDVIQGLGIDELTPEELDIIEAKVRRMMNKRASELTNDIVMMLTMIYDL